MGRIYLLIAAVIGGALSLDSSAFSETFLAIGLPNGNPLNGWMYGYSSTEQDALNYCRGVTKGTNKNNGILNIPPNASAAQKACQIVADFKNQCFAVASNGTATTAASALGWTVANGEDAAKAEAMAKCNAMRSGNVSQCILRYSYCDVSN